jgi:uncharacterized protein YggE
VPRVPKVPRVLLILAVLSLATSALAQSTAPEPPVVVASGEGVVKAAPDQAWVRIGAESRSKNPKDAQQRNAQAMSAVQQKLIALGIAKDAIKTVAIDLQLEYDYANGRQTPRGYLARNTIEVRVDELAKLGDVLDAAVGSGATLLHGLRFDLKNREQLEREALQQAVTAAVARAESMATGARRSIDRVLRIEESFGGGRPQPMQMMERVTVSAASPVVTPVEAGEIEIRAQVRVTALLK